MYIHALQVQDAVLAPQEWECTNCQNINFSTRSKCNKCGQPGPKSRQTLPPGQTSVRKARTTPEHIKSQGLHGLVSNSILFMRIMSKTSTPGQDVLKCTDAEIRDSAHEKMHPNFQQAFEEAGVPHVAGLPPGTVGGSADTVIAAMAKRGQERLNHIIRVLSGPHASLLRTLHNHIPPHLAHMHVLHRVCLSDVLSAEHSHIKELTPCISLFMGCI